MPISYYFQNEVIKFVPDASYNIPSINDDIIINNITFTIERKVLQPYIGCKRQYFINLKLKENEKSV
jgi:hypothetical protein